jgi:hypothetical protein
MKAINDCISRRFLLGGSTVVSLSAKQTPFPTTAAKEKTLRTNLIPIYWQNE